MGVGGARSLKPFAFAFGGADLAASFFARLFVMLALLEEFEDPLALEFFLKTL